MKIEHIAMYVNDLDGARTTGDGYYETLVVAIEGNLIEITV